MDGLSHDSGVSGTKALLGAATFSVACVEIYLMAMKATFWMAIFDVVRLDTFPMYMAIDGRPPWNTRLCRLSWSFTLINMFVCLFVCLIQSGYSR
jgi:hypothetical protein